MPNAQCPMPIFKLFPKGLPYKKISQYLLWGGHLVRPVYVAGKMPAPQDGIIYFLEIPKIYLSIDFLKFKILLSYL
ncbi:hypothetical protein NIES37_26370 [Tolypothrix tenuis PCC 7101]|uniref:Uncharacterized protein n=1 Tax=Tolypothrix tenuis PCC 7101 TaxID=231146 RepID=A0A1Z4MYW8_9CYAN|nr:hypothetical protein NIES37_26370 [Tolypothrix tenuis PCC 7101]BAZ77398.1 hypothetical protein NIES50_60270 [Aulosira laxa NIES-50]